MTRFCSAFSFIFALFIVSQISPLYANNAVPVLIWDGSKESNLELSPVSPFLLTSRNEFNVFLRNILDSLQPVLVYVKDNLCVEDFTQHKEDLQQATSGGSLSYFPAVEQPLDVLLDLSSYNQTYDDDVDSVLEKQLVIKSIANLDAIPETYKAIKESSPNLLTILTGKWCSFRRSERVKRDTPANTNSTDFQIITGRVLLYSSQAPSLKISEDKEAIPLLRSKLITAEDRGEGTKESPLILHLHFSGTDTSPGKIVLQFIFDVKSTGYYALKTVNYRENDMNDLLLKTNADIVYPFNFSYHCSQRTVFSNKSVSLNITDLQVQIDAKNGFGDVYDCVGFTTIPIWTGIFVTAILAIIMIWGLTMIMDIRTMDRFDDPKGKTITISAQE